MMKLNDANYRSNYLPVASRRPIERVNKYIDSASEDTINDLNQVARPREWRAVRADAQQATGAVPTNKHQHAKFGTVAKVVPIESDLDFSDDNMQDHKLAAHKSKQNYDDDGDYDDQESRSATLEEVYLCGCCGFTKQLEPAMKYLSTFQTTFYLFNFLSFAFAFALLGFGLWYRIDPKVYELHKYIETQNFTIAGWIMLFGGFVVCILSLVGFRAAANKSVLSLLFYCIIMTIVTVAFTGSLVLLTAHGLGMPLERFMSKEIYEQIRRQSMSTELLSEQDTTQFLDFIQVKLSCCGSVDFRDYQKLGMNTPLTCYSIENNYIMAPGCAKAIRKLFDVRAGLAAGFSAASIVSQLMAVVFAALSVCSIYNYRANPRQASAAFDSQTIVKTLPPVQFDKLPTTTARHQRDYEHRSTNRPSSRSSMTSIRV